MRKIFLFMMVSLDGYIEGPDHDLSWHHVDDEFNDFSIAQLEEIDLLLFGRKTYQLMASFWPSPQAIQNDPVVAKLMNTKPKIVFSTTLDHAKWENTKLVRRVDADEIEKLKGQPGKDIAVFGSSDLVVSLLEKDLVDELRLMINPVVIGGGKSLLHGIGDMLNMRLVNTKQFRSGNVLLYYEP